MSMLALSTQRLASKLMPSGKHVLTSARAITTAKSRDSVTIFESPKGLLVPESALASATVRTYYNEANLEEYFSRAKYGNRSMITVLPGDGIGPEMVDYVRTLFKVGGFPVDFEEVTLDSTHEDPENMLEAITSILRNGAALKGNIETREHSKYFLSRNVELRLRLNLFVNIVHCKSQPGLVTRHKNIDIVLIRQNTEGEYSCLEHESVDGVVESLKIVTREKTEQVARYAFDFARRNNRKKLTCVHKANIMKVADGLFLKVCTEVAKEYPDIEYNNMIIDNCSMQGTRNTGKKVAGKNIANPIAMINASADLLEYLKMEDYADIVRDAIYKTINVDKVHTPDMGGQATTTEVVDCIIEEVKAQTQLKAYEAAQ